MTYHHTTELFPDAATSTNPTLVPNRTDTTGGFGAHSTGGCGLEFVTSGPTKITMFVGGKIRDLAGTEKVTHFTEFEGDIWRPISEYPSDGSGVHALACLSPSGEVRARWDIKNGRTE